MNADGAAPWRQPGWLDRATEWTDAQLTRIGLTRTGAPEPRERAWSVVLTVPTSDGAVFLKETAAAIANDAGVTAMLSPRGPDLVLTPLAVDVHGRRMLLPHGGRLLRDVFGDQPDSDRWEQLLPRYAELQRHLADDGEALLAAGALDRRPSRIPELLADLLDSPIVRGDAPVQGLTEDERRKIEALRPAVEAAAEELEAGPIGPSLQHDDLHDGNVLVDGDAHWIVDWGDAQLAHPLATLLVTLRSVAERFGVADGDPLIARLRDAYLEPWSDAASPQELDRAVTLASWLGMVGRALTWHACLATANETERIDCAMGTVGWLQDFASAAP